MSITFIDPAHYSGSYPNGILEQFANGLPATPGGSYVNMIDENGQIWPGTIYLWSPSATPGAGYFLVQFDHRTYKPLGINYEFAGTVCGQSYTAAVRRKPFAEALRDYLQAQVDTGSEALTFYIGRYPHDALNCFAIFETGGFPPQGKPLDRITEPTIQVMSRHESYDYARGFAQGVFNALHNKAGIYLEHGYRILKAKAMQSPFSLGRDENGLVLIACNYHFVLEN